MSLRAKVRSKRCHSAPVCQSAPGCDPSNATPRQGEIETRQRRRRRAQASPRRPRPRATHDGQRGADDEVHEEQEHDHDRQHGGDEYVDDDPNPFSSSSSKGHGATLYGTDSEATLSVPEGLYEDRSGEDEQERLDASVGGRAPFGVGFRWGFGLAAALSILPSGLRCLHTRGRHDVVIMTPVWSWV